MKIEMKRWNTVSVADVPYGDMFADAKGELYLKKRGDSIDGSVHCISIRDGCTCYFKKTEHVTPVKKITVEFE